MQSNQTILTRDGTRIWISCYTPEKDNGRVIVIAPAIGISQQFYHLFALYYRQLGYTVISFDYRGIGRSAPRRMKLFRATLHEWAVQDINAVLLYAKQQYKQYEIIYIGHCIGGEIIGLAPASQYINRMVLVSTALTCEKLWPWHHRIRLKVQKAFSRVAGWLLGYLPGGIGGKKEGLPRGVSDQMANWCDSDNGLFDAYPDNNYRKLNVPVLVYTFTDDWLCPPRAVKELLNHFTNASITWHHLRPKEIGISRIGHIDFFHLSMRSVLWESLQKWLNDEGASPVRQNMLNVKRNLQ
jgi:predicted alpha/beta hydrolase